MFSDCDSELEPKLRNLFWDNETTSLCCDVLKIAAPASLSAVLGQATYLINLIVTANTMDAEDVAGLGLGHALSQFFGITIFLGLNSAL